MANGPDRQAEGGGQTARGNGPDGRAGAAPPRPAVAAAPAAGGPSLFADDGVLGPAHILALQRTAGNAAVTRALQRATSATVSELGSRPLPAATLSRQRTTRRPQASRRDGPS